MRERILDFLKQKDDYISGDYISQRLGISRQALWKHIQELKEMGYDIVAVPHLGYRLNAVADRLFAFEVRSGLATEIIGRTIVYLDRIGSTMDAALRLGLENAPEGTLVIAESQTTGRGRLGRQWLSPKYKGIYFSLILRPRMMPAQASLLTLLAAVSICDSLKEFLGIEALIKWPNDIYIANRKVAGILTELNAEMDRVNFAVIGVGMNVNNDADSVPAGAVALKEITGEWINRVGLLQVLCRAMERDYLLFREGAGIDLILRRWRQASFTLGRRVKVHCQNQVIEGEALDIDADGGLLIREDAGVTRKVMAGDVSVQR